MASPLPPGKAVPLGALGGAVTGNFIASDKLPFTTRDLHGTSFSLCCFLKVFFFQPCL